MDKKTVIADKTSTLRFSRFDGQAWGPARTVASGGNWFVNWADHPSVTASARKSWEPGVCFNRAALWKTALLTAWIAALVLA